MKPSVAILIAGAVLLAAAAATSQPPVAGKVKLGVEADEVALVAVGVSAKKQLLDKPVYNDADEKIGVIEDVIITPERNVSVAIIGVGGFLGLASHDVAIPMRQIKISPEKYVLPGATKEELKKLPAFVYGKG